MKKRLTTILICALMVSGGFAVSAQQSQQPAAGRSYAAGDVKPPKVAAPTATSPVTFDDITKTSSITFKQLGSPTSMKYLPESMGAGVALFDYDNDGRLDIFFTNGARLED